MRNMRKLYVVFPAACLALITTYPAQSASPQAQQRPSARRKPATVHLQRTIIVNKADNLLKLFVTGQPCRYWKVATGKYHCTPEGTFRIIERSVVSRSGDNPLGTRWLGLNTLGRRHRLRVGIHGTNEPQSIGHWASLACIRMHNADVNYLYELVPVGTTVKVVNIPPDKPTVSVAHQKQARQQVPMRLASLHH